MAGEANGAEFEGEAFRTNHRLARGLDQVEGDPDRVTGGIHLPEQEKLPPGMRIYRFGTTERDIARDRFGRWWIAESTAQLLARYASDAEALVWITRQHLAVSPSFASRLDRVFTAVVQTRLRCFSGVGGLVHDEPKGGQGAITWPGGAELTGTAADRSMKRQLFIPGLWKCPAALSFGADRTVEQWLTAMRQGSG